MARIKGIPRRVSGAKRIGQRVNVEDIDDAKVLFTLASYGAKHGDIGKVLPGSSAKTQIVCYFDEGTGGYTDCHEVPVDK